MKRFIYAHVALLILLFSCNSDDMQADAYGNFSATEVIISAEVSGKVLTKRFNEGQEVKKGEIVLQIDTMQYQLKKEELEAQIKAIQAKKLNIAAQVDVFEEQQHSVQEDLRRFQDMLSDGAVSQKQIDDLNNKLAVLQKQIEQVKTNYTSLEVEKSAVQVSILQVDDMLMRAKVSAPIAGTILEIYTEAGETAATGKPLFKMVNLDVLELKAYFSGNQLALIRTGQEVEVNIDDSKGGLKTYKGEISWISPRAEFTPKIIQTSEERVSLVYAVKIRVNNDGALKINMPGEVKLLTQTGKE